MDTKYTLVALLEAVTELLMRKWVSHVAGNALQVSEHVQTLAHIGSVLHKLMLCELQASPSLHHRIY